MGSFLDKPKTEKDTISGSGNDLLWACSAMQGWRIEMEDAHTCESNVPGCDSTGFFGVYDGHGGSLVAQKASKELLPEIQRTEAFIKGNKDEKCLSEALRSGIMQQDREMRKLPVLASGEDHSGSTAILSFITKSHVIIANTGDSRAVLCRGGSPYFGTKDHKPTDQVERDRVEKAGGFIEMARVCGNLAVSRAFGDYMYKDKPLMKDEEQKITVDPDMTTIERDLEKDDFLLLCCDGIWDVMSNEECCDYVTNCLKGGVTPEKTCEQLIDRCLELKSKDNMSVLIVVFPNGPKKVEGFEAPPYPVYKEEEEEQLSSGIIQRLVRSQMDNAQEMEGIEGDDGEGDKPKINADIEALKRLSVEKVEDSSTLPPKNDEN